MDMSKDALLKQLSGDISNSILSSPLKMQPYVESILLGWVELWVKAAFMFKGAHRGRKCALQIARLSVVQIRCVLLSTFIICDRAGFSSPCHFEYLSKAARKDIWKLEDTAVRHWRWQNPKFLNWVQKKCGVQLPPIQNKLQAGSVCK